MRRAFRITTAHWVAILFSVAMSIVALGATLLMSLLPTSGLMYYLATQAIFFSLALFIGVIIVATLAQYTHMIVSHELTFALIRAFRLYLYQSIVHLPLVLWGSWRHGDMLERMMRNLEVLDGLLLRIALPVSATLVMFFVWLVFLGIYAGAHTVGLIVVCVVAVVVYHALTYPMRLVAHKQLQQGYAHMRDDAIAISTMRHQLQIYGAIRFASTLLAKSEQVHSCTQRTFARWALGDTCVYGLSTLGVFITLVVWHRTMSSPTWQSIVCVLSALPMMLCVTRAATSLHSCLLVHVAWQRISEMNHTHATTTDTSMTIDVRRAPCISCSHVEFVHKGMQKEDAIVCDVSATFAGGGTSLICGRSGIGKTTLLHLLAGHYEPQQGHIYINDVDIERINQEQRQKLFTFIPQHYPILHCSVAENMHLACAQATTDALHNVLDVVGLHNWRQKLPDGLHTIIGQGAFGLSGGELRRFAIACALLRNTPIWLLDEPIANLDADSRVHVANLINQHTENRTTVLVTHSHHQLFSYQHHYRYQQGQLHLYTE